MNFAATFDVKINFDNPALYAGFAADFAKLYEKYCSGDAPSRQTRTVPVAHPDTAPSAPYAEPEPQQAVPGEWPEMYAGVEDDDASGVTADSHDKPKRRRRTKAEMEAARAAEATAVAELPKAHGNGNAGTTAPDVQTLPDAPPMPSVGPIVMPEGEITPAVLADMFGRFMMLKPDPLPKFSTQVMSALGISRVREAKPEQYRALCEGMVRIARELPA